MTDFSQPEYASYVALCRELKLEHRFQPGDWLTWKGAIWMHPPLSGLEILHGYGGVPAPPEDAAWLPSLSDWLEMLEAAGSPHVRFTTGKYGLWIVDAWSEPDEFKTSPTREEAAARLWMDVTKQEDPAGE